MPMFDSKRILLYLILALPFFSGCGPSPDVSNKEKIKEETKAMINVEKKAFEQNRYLNADEVKAVTQSMDKIASAASPEEAKKIHALTDAIKNYRSSVEEFRTVGGAKLETLKSREDLDHRIEMLESSIALNKRVRDTCAATSADQSQLLTIDLDGQLLERIAAQLRFYKRHYGKWQLRGSSPAVFDVSPGELASYNQIAADIRSLSDQQMQIMKKNTEERLQKAETVH